MRGNPRSNLSPFSFQVSFTITQEKLLITKKLSFS